MSRPSPEPGGDLDDVHAVTLEAAATRTDRAAVAYRPAVESNTKGDGMRRTRSMLVAALAALVLVPAGCGGDDDGDATDTTTTETTTTTGEPTAGGTLVGSVGTTDDPDAFVISLTTEDGTEVTTLAPGDYTLEITDPSTMHNFHLSGPGVDVSSDVGGTEDEEYDVTLEAGTYTFVCDPHSSSMNGSFEVSG
jgi:plastocyanin